MMRRWIFFLAMAGVPTALRAQTHVVKKPETVVRAVAVYEWTGDEAKPTASRLVPVSIFIDAQFRDAGVYLARPVPFALDRGNLFEMQKAGVPEGTLDIALQRHLERADATPFDDGWLAYGLFKPVPKQAVVAGKQRGPLPQVVASGGNRPHFSSKSDAEGSSTAASSDDPGRPTLTRRTDSTDSSSKDSGNANSTASSDSNRPVLQKRTGSTDSGSPASSSDSSTTASDPSSSSDSDDPHRPVLQRRSDSGSSADKSGAPAPGGSSTTSDASEDAERPTLKKRTPAQSKAAQHKGDQASVTSSGSLNDDPDRPTLHRGTAASPEIPPLNGLPADMHQMVAVSDAKDRPLHDFARPWDSDAERADVLTKMQQAARVKLATYDMQPPLPALTPAPPSSKTGVKTRKLPAPPAQPPAPVALLDETLNGYTLSYGGAATFVYTASSPGTAGATRYVSVVAQREPLGEVKVALSSVTDSNHMDRTPWMRLVDVVDAEASNRASLLFEMRAQNSRQFALYRVIGAQAQQIFETGTTE